MNMLSCADICTEIRDIEESSMAMLSGRYELKNKWQLILCEFS